MAVALLPSWRSATLYSLPLFAGRSNALTSTIFRHFPWAMPVLAIPTFQSLLELFPPFLLAVPKKKVSHSRKAMRAANKGLKDKTNIVNCPGCGTAKLAHHLCPACYSAAAREWKAQQRDGRATAVGTSLNIPTVES